MSVPLVHIGHHKTGSTWLQAKLFNRSDVGFTTPIQNLPLVDLMVTPNELVFDRDGVRKQLQDHAARTPAGVVSVFSAERISGNPHSGGYDSRLLADRVRYLFDDARILLVLREQNDMILSSYNQFIKRGGGISLERYTDTPGRRHISPLFDYAHLEYHRLIRVYYDLFGRDNVLVLPYEMFKRDAKDFVRQIVTFANPDAAAGLDSAAIPYHEHINTSLTGLELREMRWVNFFFGPKDQTNQFSLKPLNRPTMNNLFKQIQRVNRILPKSLGTRHTAKLKQEILARTQDRFCESNRETSTLIGIDLGQYGYRL